jgi:hypothetical protein
MGRRDIVVEKTVSQPLDFEAINALSLACLIYAVHRAQIPPAVAEYICAEWRDGRGSGSIKPISCGQLWMPTMTVSQPGGLQQFR